MDISKIREAMIVLKEECKKYKQCEDCIFYDNENDLIRCHLENEPDHWEEERIKFVFISLPMSGKTDKEIGHRLCSINGAVKAACVAKFGWKWDEIATIDNFWDHDRIEDFPSMPVKKDSLFYLGGSIQKMSRADAVYFDEGWEHANGCNIERYVALKYDIPVLFYNVNYAGRGIVDEEV